MPPTNPLSRSGPPSPTELARALTDLDIDPALVQPLSDDATPASARLVTIAPGQLPTLERLTTLRSRALPALTPDGHLLLHLSGRRLDPELARWRDGLWPDLHVTRRYTFEASGATTRTLLQGSTTLPGAPDRAGSIRVAELLCARPCDHVRSPALTAQKFDANAAGWDGDPHATDYLHHRWMRRHVAQFTPRRAHMRVLDFGCGAGWVGIEAALHQGAESLRFFDPSPEMVRISTKNAQAAGIHDAQGTTGFGEAPPYPNTDDAPFDLVVSSGVLSFARDLEAWYDGLAATVAPGGTLIVGDLHNRSLGMRRRRTTRPILPIRELAAATPTEAITAMEARGFRLERRGGYQLTDPFPQLLHLDSTRLRGVLAHPLSWCNRLASGIDRALGARLAPLFDSWVIRFRREA